MAAGNLEPLRDNQMESLIDGTPVADLPDLYRPVADLIDTARHELPWLTATDEARALEQFRAHKARRSRPKLRTVVGTGASVTALMATTGLAAAAGQLSLPVIKSGVSSPPPAQGTHPSPRPSQPAIHQLTNAVPVVSPIRGDSAGGRRDNRRESPRRPYSPVGVDDTKPAPHGRPGHGGSETNRGAAHPAH